MKHLTSHKVVSSRRAAHRLRPLLAVIIIFILMAASFLAGFGIEHRDFDEQRINGALYDQTPKNFTIGHLSAISPNSITVTDPMSGKKRTFAVDSSVRVRSKDQPAKLSSLKVGQLVIVRSRNKKARQVLINPDLHQPAGPDDPDADQPH